MRLAPLVLGAALSLCGCSFLPASSGAAPRSYLLAPEEGYSPMRAPRACAWQAGETLLVGAPQAQPGFDTPRMAYRPRAYEIGYYSENRWEDPPARMIGRLLTRYLGKAGRWKAVLPAPALAPARYELDSWDVALSQDFSRKPSSVRLSVSAALVDLKHSRILGEREFEIVEKAARDDPYGGVAAANRAAERLIDEVGAWIASLGEGSSRARARPR